MQFPISTGNRLGLAGLMVGVALGLLAAPASAQVNHVRDIAQPGGMTKVVSTPQGPYETSSPDYSTPASPTSYFFTQTKYYTFDSNTGVVAVPEGIDLPSDVKLADISVGVLAGQNTPAPIFSVVSQQRFLVILNFGTGDVTSSSSRLAGGSYTSLAARGSDGLLLSLIADTVLGDNQHLTVDPTTGELIDQPLDGVDMNAAFYQSYGQDGLLHVLDYGNGRMASFDPDNAFAPVSSFDLMTGITTANSQFGIGINGSFYLADGLGGGSYYNSLGQYQGTFGLPGDAVDAPYNGASYISTDSAGRVYVFDSATGFHQYQDTSVVPEPSSLALLGLAAFGGYLLRRKKI